MTDKLFIPKTISVGFQERDDTYTGKLAYVIYTDNKGVLRKEGSWQSWRSDKIKAENFDNSPTEGFVLNKGVGGARQSYGWNARNEYIRVYDPRGFEFEISVRNLLYILQECTSSKGKGLEGEFVYSWEGKDLVLLPIITKEYKESVEFSTLQAKKVSARDLIPGATYLTKKMEEVVYLGRFMHYSSKSDYVYNWRGDSRNPVTNYDIIGKKIHIFYNPKYANDEYYSDKLNYLFEPYSSMNKLAKLATEISIDNYAELVDLYLASKYGSAPIGVKAIKSKFNASKQSGKYNHSFFLNINGRFISSSIRDVYFDYKNPIGYDLSLGYQYELHENNKIVQTEVDDNFVKVPNLTLRKETKEYPNRSWNRSEFREFYSKADLNNLDWYKLKVETESGKKYDITEYKNL